MTPPAQPAAALLDIPGFLQRARTEAADRHKKARGETRTAFAMPDGARRTARRKSPGIPKKLKSLGFRPIEIKRLSRRDADELVSLNKSAEDWRRRQSES